MLLAHPAPAQDGAHVGKYLTGNVTENNGEINRGTANIYFSTLIDELRIIYSEATPIVG